MLFRPSFIPPDRPGGLLSQPPGLIGFDLPGLPRWNPGLADTTMSTEARPALPRGRAQLTTAAREQQVPRRGIPRRLVILCTVWRSLREVFVKPLTK